MPIVTRGQELVIGTSYIVLNAIAQSGINNNTTTHVTFTLGTAVGSDLTLNADTRHCDVHTTGFYQSTLLVELDSATATDIEANIYQGGVGYNMVVGSALPDTANTITLTAPIFPLTAGGQVNCDVFCDVVGHAGTYSIGSGELRIVRLS